ncbi:MAG: hypothetical protein PHF50_01545 [Patescibacteria group bacterium]|nr:hypothetical protein [Patescibacteria group bacterium]
MFVVDLRFRILVPAIAKAVGENVVDLFKTIIGGVALLAISASRPIFRLVDKKHEAKGAV